MLTTSASATAEVGSPQGTVQQAAADALFLQYAPPPPHPGIVCMVDSGVDPNPDTTPAVVGSYSLQPGTDTADEFAKLNPPIDGHPDGHGTYMAMVMAAPQNGWGMVGIAPTSVRVYNVKALPAGGRTFPFYYYDLAIQHCQKQASATPGLVVVNLSLASGTAPSSSDLASLQNDVASARDHGLNIMAAAGNEAGPVSYPAAVSGVFAVGGTDANPANLGVMCAFANRGAQLQALAPGCGSQSEQGGGGGLDMAFEDDGSPAWGQGTSEASAEVATVTASMRAYSPTIGVARAEQCISSTEVRGGNLDVAGAFRACGLDTVVSQGNAAFQMANKAPPDGGGSGTRRPLSTAHAIAAPGALPLPRIGRVTLRSRVLSVHTLNLPRGARMRVIVQKQVGKRFVTVAARTVASARVGLRVAGWDRIIVRFLSPDGHLATSPDAILTSVRRGTRHAPLWGAHL